jgi:predicted PurR-regulated permease PerM
VAQGAADSQAGSTAAAAQDELRHLHRLARIRQRRRDRSETISYVSLEPRAVRRAAVIVLLLFVAFQLAEWAFSQLAKFLFLLLLAWLFAIAMEPVVAWLVSRGMRRGMAVSVVTFVIIILTVGAMVVFGGLFFNQLSQLVQDLPSLVAKAVSWLNRTFHLHLNQSQIVDKLHVQPSQVATTAGTLAGGVLGIIGSLVTLVFDAFTVIVFAFYFSADGPRLRRTIGSWLPPQQQRVFVSVWDIAVAKTGGFVVSKVILAAISSFAHAAFFFAINVPFWLPMGLLAGITSQFIPTIGTYIGVIIPVLFTVFQNPFKALWIIIFATIYQQIENYVLTPRVSRRTMDVHPAIALAAVFVGAAFFGPIGALIGIPLVAAVTAVIDTYGRRYELVPELRHMERGEEPDHPDDSADAPHKPHAPHTPTTSTTPPPPNPSHSDAHA